MLVLARWSDEKIVIDGSLEIEVVRVRWASTHVHFKSRVPIQVLSAYDYQQLFGHPFQFTGHREDITKIVFPEPARRDWCFELCQESSLIIPEFGASILIIEICKGRVRFGCEFPRTIPVHREEVALRIQREGAIEQQPLL
jgi:sRNA-binding carbon storage regulator CsrA